MGPGGTPVLEVDDLRVRFRTADGAVQAVRGVSFAVGENEVLGIVGESGSGKSVTMLAVMGLLPRTATVEGSVRFRGEELLGRPEKEIRRYRGSRIGMIFQDPMTSFNPVLTVGFQLAEAVRAHRRVGKPAARERARELLELVGIPNPAGRLRQYPHEFSGGMRQRAMIAMAMANEPQVLVADEPTTALDVTIQAQVLEVMERVQHETGTAIIMITHDLGVIARVADRVAVMYAGKVAETGAAADVFSGPRHPYTLGLLRSLPRLDHEGQLTPIRGVPPSMLRPPPGCAFHPRCFLARDNCRVDVPDLRPVAGTEQEASCHYAEELAGVEVEVSRS